MCGEREENGERPTYSHFLGLVYGEHGQLDALGMMVINGNQDIVKLLTMPFSHFTSSHEARDKISRPQLAPQEHGGT